MPKNVNIERKYLGFSEEKEEFQENITIGEIHSETAKNYLTKKGYKEEKEIPHTFAKSIYGHTKEECEKTGQAEEKEIEKALEYFIRKKENILRWEDSKYKHESASTFEETSDDYTIKKLTDALKATKMPIAVTTPYGIPEALQICGTENRIKLPLRKENINELFEILEEFKDINDKIPLEFFYGSQYENIDTSGDDILFAIIPEEYLKGN